MFRNFIYILSFLTVLILAGCGGGSSFASTNLVSTSGGTSAKGPFVQGSTVTAYKLNDNGTKSATASGTVTTDNLGTYSLNSMSWSGATEIVVAGNYFNENDGSTNQTAELSAVVNVIAGENINTNINIFTNIASVRIKKLMSENISLAVATTSAQAMVVDLFDLNLAEGTTLESLDLTDGSGDNKEANAELLRISAAISANPTLLDELEVAVEDGNVSNDSTGISTITNLGQAVNNVNMDVVAQNLETSLNIVDAPDSSDTNNETNFVTNVNVPIITTVVTQTIVEDGATVNVALLATDADSNSVLTFTSATVLDNTLVTLALNGSTLSITPKPNAIGTSSITVVVSDGTYTDSETFSIVVSAVNDAPVLTTLSNQTKDEDASAFNIALNAADIDGDTINYTVISSDTSKATVTINGSNLIISPVLNASGTTNITVTADDGNGGTDSQTFILTLSSINDIPVLNAITNITKNEDSGTFSAGTASATDVEGNSISYSISSSDTTKATAIIGLGNSIQIVPQANANGIVTFILTANDGNGGISTETFTLTLIPVNDVPTLATLNSEFRAYGASAFNITLQGADVDNENLMYAALSADTSVVSVTLSGSTLIITPENVGTTSITATVKDVANTTAERTMNVTVSAKAITVTANTQSKVYGDDDPILTYTVNSGGLESGDTLSGTLSRATGELVNTYVTNVGTLANSNYNITSFTPSQFSITKAPLTVTVDASTKVYGEVNPTFTAQFTGFKNSDDASVVSNLIFATSADAISNSGDYDVSLTSSLVSNYEVTSSNSGTLTVTKSNITVTADGQSKIYNSVDPTLTYSITTGMLVNNDTLTGNLTRDTGENVGTYEIIVGNLTHDNYAITFVSDDLTITKINQDVLSFGTDINKTTSSPSFTQVANDGNGTGVVYYTSSDSAVATVDTSSGLVSIVDVGTTIITATKESDSNYNEITSTFTLIISPISPNNLVLTSSGDDIDLTWDTVDGATYTVHYAEESFGLIPVNEYTDIETYVSESANTNSHTITGLTGGTTYYVIVTATVDSIESPGSVELNNASSQHDTWIANASSSIVETSGNLNTLNGAYSTSAYPGISGHRLSEDKYMIGGYNSNDLSTDNLLFLYNPTTKTDLINISTGAIHRPHLLHDISKSKVALHNNKAIVLDGKAWNGGNTVGRLDITTNAFSSSTIPYADLKNSSSHMMSDYGFVEGDVAYMTMVYKNYIENPGIWIIRWDIVSDTFSHLDFTASVQTNVGAGGFDDRAQFMIRGKDSDHLLIGVYSSSVYYVVELQISTQSVVNKVQINTLTGDAGYYEPLVYKGRLYMLPRSETGDNSGLKMVKINMQNFIAELISIDEGTEKNSKRQESSISKGFSQMPTGETGIFIPRDVTITGNATEKQFVMRLDLESLSFDYISLDGNNFQSVVSDGNVDQLRFIGLVGQENGQIIAATYWKDESESDHNAVSLRNGTGIYYASGEAIASVEVSGALVDPYIVGAVMYQDDNDNKEFDEGEPESTATTATGEFTFSVELTTGKQIRIKTQGTHEGVTFDAELVALVDDQGAVAIVSPLTTFTAKGLTTQQLADILNYASTHNSDGSTKALLVDGVQWNITATNLNLDPLSGDLLNTSLSALTTTKLIELQASLTTYALLKIFEGSTTLKSMDAATLVAQGTTAGGAVAILTINMLQGVTDALNVTLLNTIETNLATLRTALVTSSLGALDSVSVLALTPTPTTDMIAKIAVSAMERISTVGFTACNAEGGGPDGSTVAAKVTAALTAVASISGTITPKIMEIGLNLYGLKYATELSSAKSGIQGAATGGSAEAGYLLTGINASEASVVTFRFDNSGNVIALDVNGATVTSHLP